MINLTKSPFQSGVDYSATVILLGIGWLASPRTRTTATVALPDVKAVEEYRRLANTGGDELRLWMVRLP